MNRESFLQVEDFGGPVCWRSTLQSTVALSTTEVEYMAVMEAFKKAI